MSSHPFPPQILRPYQLLHLHVVKVKEMRLKTMSRILLVVVLPVVGYARIPKTLKYEKRIELFTLAPAYYQPLLY